MVQELHHIDSAKKEAWNKHHKDETNKQKTIELLQEQARLWQEAREMYNYQKNYLKDSLLHQQEEHHQHLTAEQQQKLDQERRHKGFDFECYTRDQIIAQERLGTTQFLKSEQIPAEHHRRVSEVQERRAAPANLVTSDDIARMREQQVQEYLEQKSHLKGVMES